MTMQAIGFLAFVIFAAVGMSVFGRNWLDEVKKNEELEDELYELKYDITKLENDKELLMEELTKAQTVVSFLKLELKEKEDKRK